MFTLRNIDSKTLAALLVSASRSYRTQSSSKEDPPCESAAEDADRPCRTVLRISGQNTADCPHLMH